MKKVSFTTAFIIAIATCLNAQSSDKEIKFGGRIMYDMASWETTMGENVTRMSGVEFRRVRFFNSGKLYGNTKYKLQLDYSSGEISFKDVWIELGGLPMNSSIRVGHFKEPLRLEALTSSKYITFMERALPIAFSPERNTGGMIHTNMGKISMQIGAFKEGDSYGDDKASNGNMNMTGRMTYLPVNDGNRLLHIGAAMSKRKNSSKTYSLKTRAENHLSPNKLINESFTDVENTEILAIEGAYVNGRLSLQAEYLKTTINQSVETQELNGYYGQISYFITGDKKSYKNSYAGFSRVKPKNNFGKNGKGAIELVARFSKIDLTKSNLGTLQDITTGINWYLNPYTRVMLNYVMAEQKSGDGIGEASATENSIMCRVQIDF